MPPKHANAQVPRVREATFQILTAKVIQAIQAEARDEEKEKMLAELLGSSYVSGSSDSITEMEIKEYFHKEQWKKIIKWSNRHQELAAGEEFEEAYFVWLSGPSPYEQTGSGVLGKIAVRHLKESFGYDGKQRKDRTILRC